MKKKLTNVIMGLGICGSAMAQTLITGPSTSHTPYMWPTVPNATMTSILTVTESVGGYMLCGLGDGLGAYDNGGSTFTLLMNHEMGTTAGVARAHGQTGAFVSKWVINKSNLSVVSGADLIQNVHLWTGTTYTMYNAANTSTLTRFGRFCAGDLPEISAFYNSATGKGTQERIFMNGEENGAEGRAFAHISTGPNAGNTYELPYLGKYSWENAIASPYESDKTIVAGTDDATPGQVYMYIGTKTNSGNEITKAGLTGGRCYGVAVLGMANEGSNIPAAGTVFNLVDLGLVHNTTGATLNTNSTNAGVTAFLRPEDGAWDPNSPRDFYFVTTNSFTSPSRMWRLRFTDINNPELGGTITAVLAGTEGPKMMDNMVMDNHGHALIQEDPGGQNHTAKIWQYKIASDALTLVADQDSTRFKTGGVNFLTLDEESSGIIDMQGILGAGWFILFDQAHYAIPGQAVDGGQLLAFYNPATAAANPEINLQGNSSNILNGTSTVNTTNNTNLGSVNLGSTISKSFVIQNTNSGTLIVSDMQVNGTNAGDFTISGPSLPFMLNGNASQTITVTFNPAILGVRNATLNVMSSDWDEKIYKFAVQGTAVAPEINLQGNATSIVSGNTSVNTTDNTDFGTTIYNTPVVKEFVIQNTGTGTLSISNMVLTGTNISVFSFVNVPTFPLTIANGASATFSVQYLSPVPNVTNTAMISITNNDSDENTYSFKIEGKSTLDVGINSLSKTNSFVTLYPNPANEVATLKVSLDKNETFSVSVYDILGKKVISTFTKELEKGEREISLNTSNLENGEYFVQITSAKKTNTIKLVVSH
jgi:hypothetical protein